MGLDFWFQDESLCQLPVSGRQEQTPLRPVAGAGYGDQGTVGTQATGIDGQAAVGVGAPIGAESRNGSVVDGAPVLANDDGGNGRGYDLRRRDRPRPGRRGHQPFFPAAGKNQEKQNQ